jgi:DNA-binding Lrp family transcriptional regulator
MRVMDLSEFRLLNRLAIDPSLRQAKLAKDLQVTRSAVNQTWQNLESERGLRIQGNLNYGKIGLQLVFGWATTDEPSDVLQKFRRWLETSKLVTLVLKSQISSLYNSLIYFEALLPLNNLHNWFQSQIDRFRKKPYSLTIYTANCLKVSHHLNLGLFDENENNWVFPDSFRLEATINAARGYVEILPVVEAVEQTPPVPSDLDEMITAAAIERDYHTSAASLSTLYEAVGIKPASGRTLRRKIARTRRELVRPYVQIENIGLNQHILVTIRGAPHVESDFSHLLRAQAGSFPKARVLSGPQLTVLDLDAPESAKWLQLSQVMARLVDSSSEICTFIADRSVKEARLESVVSYLSSRMSSG